MVGGCVSRFEIEDVTIISSVSEVRRRADVDKYNRLVDLGSNNTFKIHVRYV